MSKTKHNKQLVVKQEWSAKNMVLEVTFPKS